MNLEEVMARLADLGSAQTRKTYMNHGAPEPLFGVRIGDLKPLARELRGDHALAMRLYATGNSDAMYLAGLVADGGKMTRTELERWAADATWHLLSGSTVPQVACSHPDALAIALDWIDSPLPHVAVAGWATLSLLVSFMPDESLPVSRLSELLDRVGGTIHSSPNRVRYVMNGFVISCGTYVGPLAEHAVTVARRMGKVEVDMGNTDCAVPDAEPYILKSRKGLVVAPKRKR